MVAELPHVEFNGDGSVSDFKTEVDSGSIQYKNLCLCLDILRMFFLGPKIILPFGKLYHILLRTAITRLPITTTMITTIITTTLHSALWYFLTGAERNKWVEEYYLTRKIGVIALVDLLDLLVEYTDSKNAEAVIIKLARCLRTYAEGSKECLASILNGSAFGNQTVKFRSSVIRMLCINCMRGPQVVQELFATLAVLCGHTQVCLAVLCGHTQVCLAVLCGLGLGLGLGL